MQPPPIGRALFRRSPKETSTPAAMIPSANQLLQQTFGGLLYEVKRALEALGAAVEGIGDLGLGTGRVVQERADLCPTVAEARDCPIVFLVHRQDVVEPLAAIGVEQAGPLA